MSQSLFQKILKGGAVVTVGRLLGVASNFALTAILARLLAPNDMGVYFLVFNLATFFSIFARFGSEQAALKIFSDRINGQGDDKLLRLSRQFSVVVLASVSVLGAVFWGFGDFIFSGLLGSEKLEALSLGCFSWSVLLAVQAVNTEIFRAFKRFILASAFKGPLASVVTLMVLAGMWQAGCEISLPDFLWLVVVIQMLAAVVSSALVFLLCERFDANVQHRGNEVLNTASIVAMSAPLFANQVAMYVATQSDLWLLQAFGTSVMVAYYGAAARLVLFSGLALQIANAVVPPFISQLRIQGETARMENMVRFVATIAGIPAMIFSVIFFFFSEEIISVVYGSEYFPAARVLIILSIGQLVNALTGSCGYALLMYGKSQLVMLVSLFGGGLAIFSSVVLLLSGKGIEEVAAAYTLVMGFQQIAMLFLARKYCGFFTHFGVFRWNR